MEDRKQHVKLPEINYSSLQPISNATTCTTHGSISVTSSAEEININVPDYYCETEPIAITSALHKPNSLLTTKVEIIVGKYARVSLQEITNSVQKSGVVNKTINVVVHEFAHVEMHINQSATSGTAVFSDYTFELHKQSRLHAMVAVSDSFYTKASFTINLNEPEAHATLKGGYLLRDNERLDIVSELNHTAPNCTSSLRLHGALLGAASAAYNGTIKVAQTAYKTNAEQYNKNMVLSQGAQAVSVPNLEVNTNDVQCRHGSAVGRFDEQLQFYMQSRGLAKKELEKLLLTGFFKNVGFPPSMVSGGT